MLVGIHVHRRKQIAAFSQKFIDILKVNKIPYVILDVNDSNFWEQIPNLTHFIYQWGGSTDQYNLAHTIMPVIENEYKVKCFPDARTYWHHDNKIREFYLMAAHKLPMIKSWIFWEKEPALDWVKQAEYPLIFKLANGAGSQDVVKVTSAQAAIKIVKGMFGRGYYPGYGPGFVDFTNKNFKIKNEFNRYTHIMYRILHGYDWSYNWRKEKNYVYFQEYLEGNEFDTRITVIGNRAFAFRRFNRKNDYRSSGSGIIDYNQNEIDKTHIKNAFHISKTLGFQSMAYDFLYNKGQSQFCEYAYCYADWAIHNCPGYWDEDLVWHPGNFWPQYFILSDLLNSKDFLQDCKD